MESSPMPLISQYFNPTQVQTAIQIFCTLIFLYISNWLYGLFFKPYNYCWDDPLVVSETDRDKSRRENKVRKRLGSLPPFPNGWYMVLPSNELARGEVKYISALGKEWSVFRTKSGKPGLLGTYCPHLGADLSQGTVVGENLVCPFHGFNFDTKGECTKIPYQEEVPRAVKCQEIPHIVEKNDAILVWYDVDGKEPQWEVPDAFDGQREKYKYAGKTHHTLHTHLQEIHENAADSAHLPVVHWKTMFELSSFVHHWGIKWAPDSELKHTTNFEVDEVVKIGDFKLPGTTVHVEGHHIGPGLIHFKVHMALGTLIVVHQLLPLEGFKVDSVYQIWTPKSIPIFIAKLVLHGWRQQLERDAIIWSQKMYLPAPQIVKNDGPIPTYRRWFKQFYSDIGTKKKFDLADKDLF